MLNNLHDVDVPHFIYPFTCPVTSRLYFWAALKSVHFTPSALNPAPILPNLYYYGHHTGFPGFQLFSKQCPPF